VAVTCCSLRHVAQEMPPFVPPFEPPRPKHVQLGRRIREARNRLGISQEHLAQLVGTHRRHVIRWEQGLHAPTGVYAERLAEILKEREGFVEEEKDDEREAEIVSELLDSLRRIVKAEMKRERRRARVPA